MGALVAAIPAFGGATAATAGSAFTLSNVAAIASIASGVAGFVQAHKQADAAEMQAQQIELQGRLDALRTNEELMKTMAMNEVAAAASGLASAGSVQYAQQQSQAAAAEQLRINRYNTDIRKAEARQRASASKTQGLFDLVGGGITAGERIGASLSEKRRING